MQNNDNQKTYFIYVRSTGEKVSVTKAQHDSFYKEADRIRHKEQDHGRCMCPYRFIWKCDSDCLDCEYHVAGDITALEQPLPDGNGTLGDYIPDRSKPMEETVADRMLLEQLFARLRELDPEGISNRAIARELGRPQKTFVDQMKKYRTDLSQDHLRQVILKLRTTVFPATIPLSDGGRKFFINSSTQISISSPVEGEGKKAQPSESEVNMMYRSYADTGGNVNEEIKLLNSISHVSARLARNLSLLAIS